MKISILSLAAGLLLAALPAQDATVTVLHGIPGLGAPVDVFANGSQLFSFDYGDQQGPLTLPPGNYALEVRQSGNTLLSLNAALAADTDYSIIANLDANGAPQLNAFGNPLDNITLPASRLYVRHTAEAPSVDIILEQNGVTVATIAGVTNGMEAQADVAPGIYSVKLNLAGTSTTAFGPVDVRVENGIGYGIFAVGQALTNNFQLLTQSVPLTARVTVVHGIPGLGAPVTVTANGGSLFTFDFREVVGPLVVLPGTYNFDALVNGNPVLSRTDTVARGDDVTIVAHLDGSANPLLSAFVNDTSLINTGNARVTVRHLAAAPTVDVVVENVGNPLATIPGLSNGNEAIAVVPLGNLSVSLAAGGNTVFGPVNFRPVDHVSYQFLALGDFAGGTFTVELVQRDLTPAVPGEITTQTGGWSCGPAIAAEPATFDYGQPWSLVATNADPGAMAIINFGDSITSLQGVALPIDLATFGAPSCFLNINLISSIGAMADAQGRVEVPFLIPGSLFGQLQSSYFQIGTSTGANGIGFATSEYLEIF
tara:strand:- start:11097 stop:12713 length:1617 start_codon:yes stop_codon:yes gene_type:complete